MSYDALVGHWNGACYETCERVSLDADDLDDAIAEVEAMTWDEDEDYDIRVEIVDEDGDVAATVDFRHSVARDKQRRMDHAWSDKGEYATKHLGVLDGRWYTWSSNGGSRGAHDRTHGSGRWIERHEAPAEIADDEAIDWLVDRADMGHKEAEEEVQQWSERTKRTNYWY